MPGKESTLSCRSANRNTRGAEAARQARSALCVAGQLVALVLRKHESSQRQPATTYQLWARISAKNWKSSTKKRTQQFGWNIAVADELAFAARKPLALVSERPDRNDDVGAGHFAGAPQLHSLHAVIVLPLPRDCRPVVDDQGTSAISQGRRLGRLRVDAQVLVQ